MVDGLGKTFALAGIGFFSLIGNFVPRVASAHEVYVLDPVTVEHAMASVSPNPFLAYFGNEILFFFWGFVAAVIFSTMFAGSIFHVLEHKLGPTLFALKKYALPIARITVGLCFVAFALSGNIYGSELFLKQGFGEATLLMQIFLTTLGALATLGLFTRIAGIGMLVVYGLAWSVWGNYLLTYTDFLGVAALLAILGGGMFSIDSLLGEKISATNSFTLRLRPYAFPFLRICFGWGVLYASIYAKFIHSQLALDVVNIHDLTRFFPFDPLFVVLGALIVEFIAGLLVFFGVMLRWTLVFLAFWLTLSLIYFQELIWPHGILFGLAVALFLHGYDEYSIGGRFFKRNGKEPVI